MGTLARYTFSIGAAATLFVGCSGSQALIGAPGVMPQSRAITVHSHRDGSWLPAGYGKKDLLYVSDQNGSEVYVLTYPKGKFVRALTGFSSTEGLCSDTHGDVWVTTDEGTYGTGTLVEFAHDGTTPIATLADPYGRPGACASDPNTGSLAVANPCDDYSCEGNVVVYPGGSGPPTMMPTPVWGTYDITYDSSGNIFVAGYENYYDSRLAWLPNGSSSFQDFNLKPRNISARGVEWDGTYLLIGQGPHYHQFKLVDGYGVRVDMVPPYIDKRAYLVLGNRLITAGGSGVVIYHYPTGATPIKTISVPGSNLVGLTISVAQPH